MRYFFEIRAQLNCTLSVYYNGGSWVLGFKGTNHHIISEEIPEKYYIERLSWTTRLSVNYGRFFEIAQNVIERDLSPDAICM